MNTFVLYRNENLVDNINYWFVKMCISSVIVTIANYIFSKVIVFKRKTREKNKIEEFDFFQDVYMKGEQNE